MMRIAYLEISARQTGKTRRLVEAAKRFAEAGRPTVVVSALASHMRPELQRHGIVVIGNGTCGVPPSHEGKDAAWLYDEFDWLDGVTAREGGYYVTTARFLRTAEDLFEGDGLLSRLLKANNWRCEKHFECDPKLYRYMAADYRRAVASDDFRCLVLGEFLK
ncbi:hypothetical protein PCO31111_04189 [Pandoraea communis]|uniref:Uncharacterized protein n=1 Tax=Pandoraea communis TaxID=2508297 RepID=A0A5E4XYC7_9BURK|nr:hypothetical protein [Pandoraea communis]VVE41350.1 hypothetical protein PCO31111_04189 [Pandoraea communis]